MFEQVQSLKNETEVNLNDQYCQHETLKKCTIIKKNITLMYMSSKKRGTNVIKENLTSQLVY
jgi:hypothetical protein